MILVALSATRKQYPEKALKNSGCSLELAVTELALITSRIIKNETTVSFKTACFVISLLLLTLQDDRLIILILYLGKR